MKIREKIFGTLLFYILWPIVWVYTPLRTRVRVVIIVKNKVLVVKNWFGPNSWQLPGGGAKFGETVIRTSIREIREELDIDLDPKLIKTLTDSTVTVHKFGLIYRLHYSTITLNAKPNLNLSSEITDTKWIEKEKLDLPTKVVATL